MLISNHIKLISQAFWFYVSCERSLLCMGAKIKLGEFLHWTAALSQTSCFLLGEQLASKPYG